MCQHSAIFKSLSQLHDEAQQMIQWSRSQRQGGRRVITKIKILRQKSFTPPKTTPNKQQIQISIKHHIEYVQICM